MNNQNPIRVRATKPQSVGELKAAFNAYTASSQGGGQPVGQPPAPAHQFQGQQPAMQPQQWGQQAPTQQPQQPQQWGQAPAQQPQQWSQQPQQPQQWGQAPAQQPQQWSQQPQQPQQWGQAPAQQPQQWGQAPAQQPQQWPQQPQQWGQSTAQPQQTQQPQQWGQQPAMQPQQWAQQAQQPQQWGQQPVMQQDPAIAEVTKQVEALANIIKGQTEAQQKAQQMAAKQEMIANKLAEKLGDGRNDIDPKELAKVLLEDFNKPAGDEDSGSAPAGGIDDTIKLIEATDPTIASVLTSQQFKDYAHSTIVGVGTGGPVTLADAMAGAVAKGPEGSVRYAVQAARTFMAGSQPPASAAPQPPQSVLGNGGYYAPQEYAAPQPHGAAPLDDARQRKNKALILAHQLAKQTGDPSYIMEASKLV